MIDSEVEVSPPSPAPTAEDYVGCFRDTVGDRVMTSVMTSDDLTAEVQRFCSTSIACGGVACLGLQVTFAAVILFMITAAGDTKYWD